MTLANILRVDAHLHRPLPTDSDSCQAIAVLARAGAEVAATAQDVLTVKGLSAERTVAALTANQVPFAEVSAHRATLEEAYMELTRDAVEFRAASVTGGTAQ